MAREPFNRIWTETPVSPDFDEPTDAMWQEGWRGGAAEEPPEAYAQNWWQNRNDYALQAIERLGAMTWHTDSEYQVGAIAVGSDGFKYLAVSGTSGSPNAGNDPVPDDGTNWIPYYDGGVPGAVQAFAMNAAPGGWLRCNGQAISRTQYARLFAQIGTTWGAGNGTTTFNVPDLRGEFVRGFDDGRGVDAGRQFASSQDDEFESHAHQAPTQSGQISGPYEVPGPSSYQYDYNDAAPTSAVGGSETRPRNVALLYCIKF